MVLIVAVYLRPRPAPSHGTLIALLPERLVQEVALYLVYTSRSFVPTMALMMWPSK
jgi:hypothetical protein